MLCTVEVSDRRPAGLRSLGCVAVRRGSQAVLTMPSPWRIEHPGAHKGRFAACGDREQRRESGVVAEPLQR